MSNRIVIIGGMGPQASILLHQRLISDAAARGARDCFDFPEIMHVSVPLRDFISDDNAKEDASSRIETVIKSADVSPKDKVVVACNTAHLLEKELTARTGVQFQSLIRETVKDIEQQHIRCIGLLASPTTIRSRLYAAACEQAGITVLTLNERGIEQTETIIRGVIREDDSNVQLLRKQVQTLLDRGAEAVILGCTELSVAADHAMIAGTIDPLCVISKHLLGEKR